MPEGQSYYRSLDVEGGNVQCMDRNLIINCTGLCVLPERFINRSSSGRNDYYLQYLVQGEMDVQIDGKQIVMLPGQAVLYYPHTEYQYSMHGTEEVRYYWVHFTGSEAAALVEHCRIPNRMILNVGSSTPIMLSFEGLFQDFILRDSCFDLSAAARLTSICVEIGRRAEAGGENGEMDSRIFHAVSYIHQNYRSNLTIADLASLSHLSVSRFRALFKARTGLSPIDYLIVLRLNHARELMTRTDLTVGEIADEVGYQDQLYFSRIFKKRTGLTPSEYRQSVKG